MLYLLRDALFPMLVFLHAVLAGAPANHGRGRFAKAHYRVQRSGRLPAGLRESSGLARADSGVWTHGDGGRPAALTLVAPTGALRRRLDLAPLPNTDWEDLAQDDAGRLYIGDFGNNANERRQLFIYRIDPKARPLRPDTIAFQFADQHTFPPPRRRRNFDCEAFFWLNDTLHLFSKDRSLKPWVKHYAVPARPGSYSLAPLDSLRLNTLVTSADVSPDGRTVALLGYGGLFLFQRQPSQRLFDNPKSFRALPRTGQAEALVFINDTTMLVSNEKGRLFMVQKRRTAKRKKP